MQVLLAALNSKYIHSNLAIRILYQLNKHHPKIKLQWKEFTIKQSSLEIADFCKPYNIVAFSCYIWNISYVLKVAKVIKENNPDCKILLGGPEVTYEFDEFINLPQIDYIISGEGELPFKTFLEQYPIIENVPNLVYKKEGKIIFNKKSILTDINWLNQINPYVDDVAEDLTNRVLYIETSRGCPYKCEFCLASLDNTVQYLAIETTKQNLLFLMQHGRVIKFLDRTFNIKKDFTIDIFEFILNHRQPGNIFQFEITADILHPAIIKYIDEKVPPGVFRFEIGIQTVNQKANLEVNRKQDFEKTKQVINSIRHKIELHLDLIVGLPFDYLDDIKHSINTVLELQPPELQLGFLKFLRGTPVKEKHPKHGYVFQNDPPYQIIKSNYLSEEEIKQIELLEHILEIYWNKKRSVYTLLYLSKTLSIADFFIEFGNYFKQHVDLIYHTQEEVYIVLYNYIKVTFPQQQMLIDLLAFDYVTTAKVKPKPLFKEPLPYIESKKIKPIPTNKKIRIVYYELSIHPLKPDVPQKTLLELHYTGTHLPEYFIHNSI